MKKPYFSRIIACLIIQVFLNFSICYGLDYTVEQGQLINNGDGTYTATGDTAVSGAFNINEGESITINGQNNAQLIWRDNSGVASQINGSLNLYNLVFALINNMGINISRAGCIRAMDAALILSTLNITNQDFFNKNYQFSNSSAFGKVVNKGEIHVDDFIAIIGHAIENDGSIVSKLGSIALGCGDKVGITMDNEGLIGVIVEDEELAERLREEQDLTDRFVNNGKVHAEYGDILISAGYAKDALKYAVNNKGALVANSIEEHGGRIVIRSKGAVRLAGDSVTSVSAIEENAQRGRIDIQSDDAVIIEDNAVVSANAENNSDAGYINIDGHTRGVLIKDNASIEAKGAEINSEAGRIFINSYHDIENPMVRVVGYLQGNHGFIADNARLDASGGDGDGGHIDFSGKDIRMHTNNPFKVANNEGKGGKITFDPLNIEFRSGTGDSATGGNAVIDGFGGVDISELFADDAGETIVFDVNGAVTNLLVTSTIGDGATITFEATNDITVYDNWSIKTSVGGDSNVNLVLSANNDINLQAKVTADGTGTVTMTADADTSSVGDITMTAGSRIQTISGKVTLSAYNVTDVDVNTSSGGGDVEIDTANNVTIDTINAGSTGDVDIDSGNLINGSGIVDITGNDVILDATNGIGTLGAIETQADTLTLTSAAGTIDISEDDDVTISSATTTNQAITINTGKTAGGDTILTNMTTGVGIGDISVTAARGDIVVAANGVDADGGSVTLEATTGSINEQGAGDDNVNVTGVTVTLTAQDEIGGSGALDFETDASTLIASSTTSGNIILDDKNAGGVNLGSVAGNISTTNGSITLTTAGNATVYTIDANGTGKDVTLSVTGNIIDGDDTKEIESADALTIQASGVIGVAGAGAGIDFDAVTLNLNDTAGDTYLEEKADNTTAINIDVTNSAGLVDIEMQGADDIIIAANNTLNAVTLNAGNTAFSYSVDSAAATDDINVVGALSSGTANFTLITDDGLISGAGSAGGSNVTLNAENGINVGVDCTTVTAVNTTANNIQIVESSGDLTVASGGVTNTGGGTVIVTAPNSLVLTGNVTANGGGAVTLTAGLGSITENSDASADVITSSSVALNSATGINI
ncbi:MAG: hypothetical protein KKH94_13765, partial [Candidatus Omnitrophica bacterium]|nr:hypothetical protein [Candidatus Omnitrophota bacterium]